MKPAVVLSADGVTVSAVQPVGTVVDRPLSAFTDPNAVLGAAPWTTAVVPAPPAPLLWRRARAVPAPIAAATSTAQIARMIHAP